MNAAEDIRGPAGRAEWEKIRGAVESSTGMNLGDDRSSRFDHAVQDLVRASGSGSADLLSGLIADETRRPGLMGHLVRNLTVGETYFFRGADHFQAIREHVIPDRIAARGNDRTLRIWSAGCATGEEPYSLAILLDRDFPHLADWNVEILATDLNADFIARAVNGRYRHWSFRGSEIASDTRYFHPVGELIELDARLRKSVRFMVHNLAVDPFPRFAGGDDAFDLILFRNVAIYLRSDVIRAIIARFAGCLSPGGYLLLGESELREDLYAASGLVRAPQGLLKKGVKKGDILQHSNIENNGVTDFAGPQLSNSRDINVAMLENVPLPAPAPAKDDLSLALEADGRGDLGAATLHLRRALYLQPRAPLPWFLLGTIETRLGRTQDADRAFRNARELTETLHPAEQLPYGEGLTAGALVRLVGELLHAGALS
ncbi:MAG: CheR family methyltransferase [Candidatus Hydrogenedentota bacterium]